MTRRRIFRPSRWALLLLVAAGLAVAADMYLPAGLFPSPEHRVILIQRGQTLREVSEELKRVGLLSGTLGFQVLARAMRLDRNIRAGQYSFQLGTSVPALLRALARGMSGLNVVTIPEGLTTTEVSLLLSNHLGVPVAEFDSLAKDRAFLDSLGISAPSIEGYLAPDSYEFLPGTSPEVAFRTMAKRTLGILLRAAAGRDSLPLGLSLHQVLTLASIVEAEAGVDIERPRIASVYLNRLAMGMRLQADPTVGYAIGGRPRTRLYFRDLRVASPFNTYLYEGLPPGPICNPGRASIAGVIDPLPGLKELYFVADGTGRHLFSETYEQHVARIRQVRSKSEPEAPAVAPDPARTTARTDTGAAGKLAARPVAATPAPRETATVKKPAAAAKKPASAVKKPAANGAGKAATSSAKDAGMSAAKKPAASTTAAKTTAPSTTVKKPGATAAKDTSATAARKPASGRTKKAAPTTAAPVTKPVAGGTP